MRLLPFAQLLRIPNVFTAFADILLGTLATRALSTDPGRSTLLVVASGCLYCSGMIWNDYFDLEIDKKERPFRPLPSRKISTKTALMLAIVLMLVGIGLAGIAGNSSLTIAAVLALAILLYDGALKKTPVGPISMATCRFLNVLLGLSLVDTTVFGWNERLHLAAIVGLYIVGVTWFARSEAGRSNQAHLRGAAATLLAALLLAVALPAHPGRQPVTMAFPYLIVAFGFLIGIPVTRAVTNPEPKLVQYAVKRCILGLVVLDGVLATVYVGPWGLLIVFLLPPALLLGKRVYST